MLFITHLDTQMEEVCACTIYMQKSSLHLVNPQMTINKYQGLRIIQEEF